MNITVIGAGNVGIEIAAEFSMKGHKVSLYTNAPLDWQREITVVDGENSYKQKIGLVTNNLEEALQNTELVMVTIPAFLFQEFADKIIPFIKAGMKIVFLPGLGGVEYIFSKHIQQGVIVIGLQRVPAVYRIVEKGKKVKISGRRKEGLNIAVLPNQHVQSIQEELESLFGMKVHLLPNFLCVTLTPSNPILHTSRIYAINNKNRSSKIYDRNILFYEEWDDTASKILLQCDEELQQLINKIDLDLRMVKSLIVHYESTTPEELTKKMKSIESLKGVYSPMIECNGGWEIDWNSRYLKADFPYGLAIIKGISELFSHQTPTIDIVLKWFSESIGQEYYIGNDFIGKDLIYTGIPQNYGIDTVEKFLGIYNRGRFSV